MKTTAEIKKLNILSIATVLKLFIAPIATWHTTHMYIFESRTTRRVNTAYLKIMLSVSKVHAKQNNIHYSKHNLLLLSKH